MREIGPDCPICGGQECWRQISVYRRLVIELLPYHEERIPVARFLCRETGLTFSLLPVWLVPYHQYTAASMLFALLLAMAAKPNGIKSLFAVAEKLIEAESKANGFLLSCWSVLCVVGLRRAHTELARWAELGKVKSGPVRTDVLVEVAAYCQALGIRGPPHCNEVCGLDEVLQRHARTTGRFLLGTPSQERGGGRSP